MTLTAFDWSVIAAYFLFNLGIGLYYARRAGSNTQEFFLSGRDVPWWLAGTSMVATTLRSSAIGMKTSGETRLARSHIGPSARGLLSAKSMNNATAALAASGTLRGQLEIEWLIASR